MHARGNNFNFIKLRQELPGRWLPGSQSSASARLPDGAPNIITATTNNFEFNSIAYWFIKFILHPHLSSTYNHLLVCERNMFHVFFKIYFIAFSISIFRLSYATGCQEGHMEEFMRRKTPTKLQKPTTLTI